MPAKALNIWLLLTPARTHAWEIVRGISEMARQRRWMVSVHDPEMVDLNTLVNSRSVDGVIGTFGSEKIRDVIRRKRLPAVCLTRRRENDLQCVHTDDRKVGEMAADYLLGRGFSRFVYLGPRNLPFSHERGTGFTERLQNAKAHVQWLDDPKVLDDLRNFHSRKKSDFAWLRRLQKPVAVFAMIDLLAREVACACMLAEVVVPDEVAILGVHNAEATCEMTYPSLSSVATPANRMMMTAAQLLARQIDGDRKVGPPVEFQPIGVVSRKSTDVIAVNDPMVIEAVRYMRLNLSSPIDVRTLVRDLAVSRRQLERKFAQVLNRTPLEELHRLRVARAMESLGRGATVAEAARDSGFSRGDQLAKAIRRATGANPRDHLHRMKTGDH